MQFNEQWLREWVDPRLDSHALSELLTLAGLEVESRTPVTSLNLSAANRRRLLVGRIEEVKPHPKADKLKLCKVQIGPRKWLSVVCGAPNASVGLVAPIARIGAEFPGMKIEKTTIRGVVSEGMLCSARELGLAEQSASLMELDADAIPGTALSTHLALDDQVFELGLTPNRGDCLSVRGIAREVAVLSGSGMKIRPIKPIRARHSEKWEIQLQAPEQCARFVGRVIRGIDMHARSPDWMQERIRRAGLRPINPVVDITNLVMLEIGQPMHAYDLDKLSGMVMARLANNGERLRLLDGSMVRLRANDLVIADQKKAVGLAGIMGGEQTAISATTTNIFLEAAFFCPQSMQGKARRLGMHTDASHRFERGVDPTGQVAAIEMATRLLLAVSGGEPGKVCHAVSRRHLPIRRPISLERSEPPRILGMKVPDAKIERILTHLGMSVSSMTTGWKVTPPPWRFDLTGSHDLVEEIGRCHGFGKVPARMPVVAARVGGDRESIVGMSRLRQTLTARGYHEAINYSFVDPKTQQKLCAPGQAIALTNPLAENMSEMRLSLLPGLLANVQRILNRQESRVRLFETGNVFRKQGHQRLESPKIGAVITGSALPCHWSAKPRMVDFFDLKGDLMALLSLTGTARSLDFQSTDHPLLHPGQCAQVIQQGRLIGHLGKLHPRQQNMLDIHPPVFLFELELSVLTETELPKFKSISRFPIVLRDLSVVVPQTIPMGDIIPLVRKAAGENLKSIELFDIYTGEKIEKNKKSLTFRLVFQSESRNLTSDETDFRIGEIMAALNRAIGGKLRT